jgi:hypothetical protein
MMYHLAPPLKHPASTQLILDRTPPLHPGSFVPPPRDSEGAPSLHLITAINVSHEEEDERKNKKGKQNWWATIKVVPSIIRKMGAMELGLELPQIKIYEGFK